MGRMPEDLTAVLEALGADPPATCPSDLGTPGRTKVWVLDSIVVKCDDRLGTSAMVRERAALEMLVDTNLPVPRLIGAGAFDDGRLWVAVQRLDGTPPPDAARPAHEISPGLAEQLGQVIAELHLAVEPPSFGTWVVNGQRSLIEEETHRLRLLERMAYDAGIVSASEIRNALSVAYRTVGALETCPRPVLAHRDVQPRNVLVVGDRLSALLDFESAAGGDPAEDFKVIGLDWSTPAFAAFARAYTANGGALGSDGSDRVAHHVLNWAVVVFAYLGRIAPQYLPAARLAVERVSSGERPAL